MPRLFLGLEVPAPQRAALMATQTGLPDARWVEAGDLHVTLRFIGDVGPKQADAIVAALDERRWTAPQLSVTRYDAFGGNKPRSVVVRLAEDPALMRLAASMERLMQRLELPAEGRRYTPHITLGRFRGTTTPAMVALWLAAQGPVDVPPWEASRYVLYSARDSVGGGPYHAEEAFELAPASKPDRAP